MVLFQRELKKLTQLRREIRTKNEASYPHFSPPFFYLGSKQVVLLILINFTGLHYRKKKKSQMSIS